MLDPRNGLPEFDASFEKLFHPAVRKSRRQRKNITDTIPTPPPSSSTEDKIFLNPRKRLRGSTLERSQEFVVVSYITSTIKNTC